MIERRYKRTLVLTPSFKCECCGRIMVLLREPDWTPKERKWAPCFAKGWDGNPWYVTAVHRRHARNKWAIYLERMRAKIPKEDPFFTLDG